MVAVELQEESDGVWWAHFPVRIGLGTAMAALRMEGGVAQMPLGARPGEFSLDLTRTEGTLDSAVLDAAKAAAFAALEEEQGAWQDGAFLLREAGRTVGEIRFRGERPPLVAVYDSWWLTPAPVPADVVPEGADLVLRFSVEPEMAGEDAELRINVPLRQVVVPIGDVPVAEERRFELVAGGVSEDERLAAIAQAIAEADAREALMVRDFGAKMIQAAKTEYGCLPLKEMDEAYRLIFTGYDVKIVSKGDECVAEIEPSRSQHGRRYKGVIGGR